MYLSAIGFAFYLGMRVWFCHVYPIDCLHLKLCNAVGYFAAKVPSADEGKSGEQRQISLLRVIDRHILELDVQYFQNILKPQLFLF